MTVSILNSASYNPGTETTSITFAHTPPANTTLLVAFLLTRGNGAYITNQVCSQSFGGSPPAAPYTLLKSVDHNTTYYLTVSIFFLVYPSYDSSYVTMSWTGAARPVAGVFALSDALPPNVATLLGKVGTTSPMTVDIVSKTGDLVLAGIAMEGSTTDTLTPTSGVTEAWNLKNSTSVYGAAGSKAGETACTIGWNIGNRANMQAVNIPSISGSPAPFVPRISFS